MDPGSLKRRSFPEAARAPCRNCAVFIPLKRRLFPLRSPLKGCFPSSSSLPSSPVTPSFFSLPSRRFIFGGRVLDITRPASIGSANTHCTTCPNSISNYYSIEHKPDAGKYLFWRRSLYGTQVKQRLRNHLSNEKAALEMSAHCPKKVESRTRACWVITLQQKAKPSGLRGGSM